MSKETEVNEYRGALAAVAYESLRYGWSCKRNRHGRLVIRVDDKATVYLHTQTYFGAPSNNPLGLDKSELGISVVATIPLVCDLELSHELLTSIQTFGVRYPVGQVKLVPQYPETDRSNRSAHDAHDERDLVRVDLQYSAHESSLSGREFVAALLDLAHSANQLRGALLQAHEGCPYSTRVSSSFNTQLTLDPEELKDGKSERPVPDTPLPGVLLAPETGNDLPALDPALLKIRDWTLSASLAHSLDEPNVLALAQVVAKRNPSAFARAFGKDATKAVLSIHPGHLKKGGVARVDSILNLVDRSQDAWEMFVPHVITALKQQCPDLSGVIREAASDDTGQGRPPGAGLRRGPRGRGVFSGTGTSTSQPQPTTAGNPPAKASLPVPSRPELEAALKSRVRGQDEAAERVASRVVMAKRGLDGLQSTRPDGVFLFAGPTGVGKTEMAKALADRLYGEGSNLITLDMSEYTREWAVSRLVGPNPGYVGSDKPGSWLTSRIIQNPNCVLLLDEFEKADEAVWQTFLQVFSEGRLTDGQGCEADFSNVVIILTSNLGSEAYSKRDVGFAATGPDPEYTLEESRQRDVLSSIRDRLPPELFNRIDQSVVFRSLEERVLLEIAEGKLAKAKAELREVGFKLSFSSRVAAVVAAHDADPTLGARPLNRAIDRLIREPLAELPQGSYKISAPNGQLVFRPIGRAKQLVD